MTHKHRSPGKKGPPRERGGPERIFIGSMSTTGMTSGSNPTEAGLPEREGASLDALGQGEAFFSTIGVNKNHQKLIMPIVEIDLSFLV
ncbi:hypothetical protein [Burkholderia gladioli]|uniref:hypothetical protein n=1 Tax=Burkholderia gladioli TaxID=28095 RepID=UPI001C5D0B18|nr:hypothetical protein [Burkholderia gladioli]MBW5286723.1 hypothetical protein [Burkholderia gladioli]